MKRAYRNRYGKGPIELIEEATHLLRTAPAGVLAGYYVGSVPLVLGWLFFWGDMSSNAFAAQHLAGAALGMTLLFIWMKWWHVYFARNLRAFLAGQPLPTWNFARCRRVFVAQAVLQPAGLYLVPPLLLLAGFYFLPLVLILALPYVWIYSFFQNLTALDDGEGDRLRSLLAKAYRQANLWRGQNFAVLIILALFSLCVCLFWGVLCFLLPGLGKMLLGFESVFTRSGMSVLNTTFFAVIVGLTYLSVDPIVKAVYSLRCFYGESLQSGEDLKVELKRLAVQPLGVMLLALTLLGSVSLPAQEAPAPPAPQAAPTGVTPPDLNRAIDDVVRQNKYTWRAPRDKVVPTEERKSGWLRGFFEDVTKWMGEKFKAVGNWLGNLLDKLFGRTRIRPPSGGPAISWIMLQQLLLWVLVLAVGVAIFFLLYRVWRNKYRRTPEVIQSEAIHTVPDLADENVSAEQLPEDGWTKLARELLERGEWRLALRAFYLASLAHLAQRNLISLAKFKSNHDYERELQRRGHSFPALLSMFGENNLMFDRTWYGRHEANRDVVLQFATNVDKIKAGG